MQLKRKDQIVALKLYKKYYKKEFEKRGKSVERQLKVKLEEHLERDLERTNQLNKVKKKEWAEFMNDAERGDKDKKRVIDKNAYVKEIKSLCYFPA